LRPFVKPQPSRRIGAIWRKSSARQAAIQMVSDVIAEQLA
jgi:DNA-binding transcriptional LysR family regulator